MNFTTLVDVAELGTLLQEHPSRLLLLDCRFDLGRPEAGRRAYADGHIPGARYADLNRNLAGAITAHSGRHPLPAPDQLRGFLISLGLVADTQVVAYDEANGSFAARAWWLLRWLGHSRTAVLDGGYRAWLEAGGAAETGEDLGAPLSSGRAGNTVGQSPAAIPSSASPSPSLSPSSSLSPKPSPPATSEPELAASVTAADVMAALEDPRRALVDARAPERFVGDIEPIDPIAGHVAGAVNHPFSRNLDADSHFLPPDELRRRWLDILGRRDPRDAILMCGSGVTACHNALAMEIAGLPGAKLYAGSWSEWIRDPARPVARGAAR